MVVIMSLINSIDVALSNREGSYLTMEYRQKTTSAG